MSIQWGKLVAQGRAKAIGISWTEAEANEIAKASNREEVINRLRGVITEAPKEEKVEAPKEEEPKEEAETPQVDPDNIPEEPVKKAKKTKKK